MFTVGTTPVNNPNDVDLTAYDPAVAEVISDYSFKLAWPLSEPSNITAWSVGFKTSHTSIDSENNSTFTEYFGVAYVFTRMDLADFLEPADMIALIETKFGQTADRVKIHTNFRPTADVADVS